VSREELRVGVAATVTSGVLLLVAVLGVAPHVLGGAAGECEADGPHLIFLIAWGAAALLGIASAIHLSTGHGQPKGPPLRRAGFWGAVAVVVGTAALFVTVVLDGIGECGF
jgi:hypothetical protein